MQKKESDFFPALEILETEKGIKKEIVIEALETALVIAYKKHSGTSKAIEVRLKPEAGKFEIYAYQNVVELVENKESEISLEDARLVKRTYKVGDRVQEKISPKGFGRIAAQTARQVIMQKLREVETEIAYSELTQKEDELVSCVVGRIEDRTVYVEINKQSAALNPQDQMPNDKFKVGDRIKVYVKKIKAGNKGPQIIVSRTVAGFVKRLFELEVPEIANGIVSVKAIVREAGYRTKIAVYSSDPDVDAVGACVGNHGNRVSAIVSELDGEKIDIIPWCEDALEFVARALSPAKVVMVEVNDDSRSAKAIVDDGMLSLAIGRDGQNARLAARLTNFKIDVKPYSSIRAEQEEEVVEEEIIEEVVEEAQTEVFEEDLSFFDED